MQENLKEWTIPCREAVVKELDGTGLLTKKDRIPPE